MFKEKPTRPHPRSWRESVEFEEERAWVSFYAQVSHDATAASEVLAQLEADPGLKRDRLALYLRCKESMRAYKARQIRNRRIGQAVRLTCHWLLVRPARALRRGLQQCCSLAVECLPETVRESAAPRTPQVRRAPDLVRRTSTSVDPACHPSTVGTVAEVAESEATRTRVATKAA